MFVLGILALSATGNGGMRPMLLLLLLVAVILLLVGCSIAMLTLRSQRKDRLAFIALEQLDREKTKVPLRSVTPLLIGTFILRANAGAATIMLGRFWHNFHLTTAILLRISTWAYLLLPTSSSNSRWLQSWVHSVTV